MDPVTAAYVKGAIIPVVLLAAKVLFDWVVKRGERDLQNATLIGKLDAGFTSLTQRMARVELKVDKVEARTARLVCVDNPNGFVCVETTEAEGQQ